MEGNYGKNALVADFKLPPKRWEYELSRFGQKGSGLKMETGDRGLTRVGGEGGACSDEEAAGSRK
jgi:hypothetical protein